LDRQQLQWRDSHDGSFVILGNRGVKDGDQTNAAQYNASVTLKIHGTKQWFGNICFNDNHTTTSKTFFPENVNFTNAGVLTPDNIFKNDWPGGGPDKTKGKDSWLTITRALTGDATTGATDCDNQWD